MLDAVSPGKNLDVDFFDYWESLGFFENLQATLPPNFFVLFNIARLIFSEDVSTDAFDAIEEISKEERVFTPDRDETIQVNRLEKIAPVSDRMEIDTYKTIIDLKKALPRELALEDDVFNAKLFTKTLLVMKHYESEADSFKPISTSRDKKGKDAQRFEQKFYILLDRSKSMEVKMRTFYSKCIVAEFLRRKLNSKAKLYYRPFDTHPGELFKIEKKEDFPRLIEEVLLTTTGGNSTNIQAAVFQAVNDILFDKEMMKAEILVVTDGISAIDRNEMKFKLGDIKLNVLKIGDEVGVPDFYEMESYLKKENVVIDSNSFDIKNIKQELQNIKNDEESTNLSLSQRRAYRNIFDASEKMFKDLKELSRKYIEIGDLNTDLVFEVTDEQLDYIKKSVDRFEKLKLEEFDFVTKKKLFRQVQFLYQYINMLMDSGNAENSTLQNASNKLMDIKQKMLKDPDVLMTFMEAKELKDDKEMMKLAKKEAKRMLKQMQLNDKRLSIEELKNGQLLFTMDVGKGSMGQLLILLFLKLVQLLKKLFLLPARIFAGSSKEE